MNSELKPLILIHGLLRTKYSMWYLGRALSKYGYTPYLFGYPSRKLSIDQHARALKKFIADQKLNSTPIYFVTHSLGSIVLRQFVANYATGIQLGRAVNLGPPHQGSMTARSLARSKILRAFLGPAFIELTTMNISSATSSLEVGVIAGRVSSKSGYYFALNGENDGIVTVDETLLAGLKDHIITAGTHSFLMYKNSVIELTKRFLETGSFK